MKALLELYVEDLPPSEFPDLLDQMADKMKIALEKHSLTFSSVCPGMTVRRLFVKIDELSERQPDRVEEIKGPPESVAFSEGNPTRALEGFLRKHGADIEDVVSRDGYVYLVRKIKGRDTATVLPDVFRYFIESLEFKKNMRWGEGEYEFVRPVHSILALLDGDTIEFELFGHRSGRKTRGLRFHSGEIEIESVEDYERVLEENLVVVDLEKRKRMITAQLEELGMEVDLDEDLIEEVAYLTEYPKAVVGKFDPTYLELPPEVVITTVKHHERTFIAFEDGKITNVFVGFQDGPGDPEGNIRRGFERVINARLEDARYYYQKDLEEGFEKWNERLKGMVFQEKLGSLYDKVLRIRDLALKMAKELGFSDTSKVERAAMLSKADLASKVVYEFPELQGVMGRIYALENGEDEEVAWAIQQQYDSDPESPLGALVGMADRLDTIVGDFAVGNIPSGSKDPYGLRKKMDDVFHFIRKFGWNIDLDDVLEFSRDLLGVEMDMDEIREFARSRFRAFLMGKGVEPDVARAVEHMWNSPLRGILAAEALNELVETPEVISLRVGFERIHNMVRNHDDRSYDGSLMSEDAEVNLLNRFFEVRKEVAECLDDMNYKGALRALVKLKPHVDRYFDEVFVMVDREDIRRNRLGFLKNVDDLFMSVADLSKISKERVLEREG